MTGHRTSETDIGRLKCLLDGDHEGLSPDLNDHEDLIRRVVTELENRPRIDISAELRDLQEIASAVYPSTARTLREIGKRISAAVSPKYVQIIGEDGCPTGYHREPKSGEIVTLENGDD